jgi:PAS domain S-box-containing protein
MRHALGTPMGAISTITSERLAGSWLAAIVESSDDAIVSKTLDGIVTSWNPSAEKLFGYTAEEMIGRPIAMLAAPDRENEMPAILESIRRGEKLDHYETVRRRKDGSLVDISLTVSPIRNDTGRIVGASKIARDITVRKRLEERQRMLSAELSHRVKNLFAVVQVLAERSASEATSAAECIEAFRSRLQALNAAHSGDSETRARLVPICPQALRLDADCQNSVPYEVLALEAAIGQAEDFDVIHFHEACLHLPWTRRALRHRHYDARSARPTRSRTALSRVRRRAVGLDLG